MKTIILFTAILITSLISSAQKSKSFYDLQANTIDGEVYNFSSLKGKKVLIVNTASKCGLTPQYEQLEALYNEHKDKNFIIIGFPANDFLSQEPGSNAEIKEFCKKNYGVTFPMMSKISVKGDDMHPVYKWLTSKSSNGLMDSKVKWNFQKYMVDENGKLIGYADPSDKPDSERIINFINGKQ